MNRDALDADDLTRLFEAERPRLRRVAYGITGSLAEAEDCVQEAWLRLRRVEDPSEIRDGRAWLTTAVSRLALDALGSARARREEYVGTWLPEPLVDESSDVDPAARVAQGDSITTALLVLLERLSEAERAAFLLHDVFGHTFDEIAAVVGRSPAAVRQLATRARKHIEEGRPRFPPTQERQRELVSAFTAACETADLGRIVELLHPEVVWRADGGGRVRTALPFVRGSKHVARGLVAFMHQRPTSIRIAQVNGAPGLVLRDADGILTVCAFTIDHDRIVAIDVVRNPEKLTSVRAPDEGPSGGGVA
jgi:RNA polymerase sigma-70 factor (ECF subfamily)